MNINLYLITSALLFNLIPLNQTAAQSTTINLPNCTSAGSDSDGDGFGYENDQSCIVVGGQSQVGQCVDTDGDGFGWNGVETCDPSVNTNVMADVQPGACVDTDGDGFGWNGVETCDVFNPVQSGAASLAIPIAGTWYCESQLVTSEFFDPGVSRSGTIVNDSVRWDGEGISSSTAQNFPGASPCNSRGGHTLPAISRYIFEDNGNLTISSSLRRISSCESNPTIDIFDRTDFGSWSFDGNSITVNGTVMREFGVQYKSVFRETEFVESFRLLNLYIDNQSRLSCRPGRDDSDLAPVTF